MNSKINILHVGPLPPPYSGLNVSFKSFIESDLLKNFNNFVYNISTGTLPGKSYKLKMPTIKRIYRHFKIALDIFLLLRKNKINILHFQGSSHDFSFIGNWLSILFAKILRVKILWHIHDDLSDKKVIFPGNSFITKTIFSTLIKTSDCVATLTEKSKLIVEKFCPKQAVEVISPCISLGETNKTPKEYGEFIVLFVGWLIKDKGIFDLIKIMEKLKNFQGKIKCIVLGTGMSNLETNQVINEIKIKNLNDLIELKGVVIGKEKELYFRKASIFLSPTYWDAFPLVILEAMAFGLPIISTKVGGIPEILNDKEYDFLFEPGDVEGMSNAIIKLYNNPKLCSILGERNKKRFIEKYHMDIVVNKTIKVYWQLYRN